MSEKKKNLQKCYRLTKLNLQKKFKKQKMLVWILKLLLFIIH